MIFVDINREGRIVRFSLHETEYAALKRYRESELTPEDIKRLAKVQRMAPEVLRKPRQQRKGRRGVATATPHETTRRENRPSLLDGSA